MLGLGGAENARLLVGSESRRDLNCDAPTAGLYTERAAGRTNPRTRLARPEWERFGTLRTARALPRVCSDRLSRCAHMFRLVARC
jgi:hypothetical protein